MSSSQNDSDSESMDVDDTFNDTQDTQVSGGPPGAGGGGGDPHSLTDIYAKQYEEAQKILQEGSTSAEAVLKVGQLLKDSSLLCKQEKKVQESVFGSSVLSICAQISRNQALALDTNLSAFDVQAFADGIISNVCDPVSEAWDWERLSQRTFTMFKRSPGFSYMFGSFKPTQLPPKEPKERAPRRQANRAAAQKKEPEKVTNVQATDEGNDKAVQHLKKVLKRQFRSNGDQPIGFFDCVLDPHSFHHTVENIFHLSFLMKNNFCAVKQENGGLPYIHPVSASEVNDLQKGKKLQCIVSISPEEWETLLQAFEIREPMVPPMA
ncbi:hypothetical protein ONE63_008918 [Megalurothrips usitatus]|uniref:Non-structural maintenance of chromosomes element 4 n=1 Tax=Megalurothrips usitatus TaxID=439358 RepID=A0AAV7XLD9_9NEOP|nr:hypothetical protein ONE63_008918 [Megalurothrips usitatus]